MLLKQASPKYFCHGKEENDEKDDYCANVGSRMIDIHTHILPGLDDGPRTLDESVAMALAAVNFGTHTLLATPHLSYELYPNHRDTILAEIASLERALRERGIPLRVLPGSEVLIHPDLVQRLNAGELLTLNDGGKYLLVEYPFELIPPFAEKVLGELLGCGVTPILAHPERNLVLAHRPQLILELVQRGVLMQVTAGSITGRFGSAAAQVARLMIENKLVHFIATDMHDNASRGTELKKALAIATSMVGKEQVRYWTDINAKCVLRGVGLPQVKLQPPATMAASGIWQLFEKMWKK